MADTSTLGDTLDINVLIGADYYWQFATGNIRVEYLDPQELKRNSDGCYPVPCQDK